MAMIHDELLRRYGKETAFQILSTAVKNYGRWFARRQMRENKEFQNPDTRNWLTKTRWETRIMEKEVLESSKNRTVITENYCAMVRAWKDLGKSAEEIETLCVIAMFLEEGMNEEYPITMKTDKRISRGEECCRFILEKK